MVRALIRHPLGRPHSAGASHSADRVQPQFLGSASIHPGSDSVLPFMEGTAPENVVRTIAEIGRKRGKGELRAPLFARLLGCRSTPMDGRIHLRGPSFCMEGDMATLMDWQTRPMHAFICRVTRARNWLERDAGLLARREEWTILAETKEDAERVARYHFCFSTELVIL